MQNRSPEPYSRMDNGVKIRNDGKGDAWARAHRGLGTGFQMHDIDATFGLQVFGANTGEKLFLEYEPDNYENRLKEIRRFAAVALFDRKSTEDAAFGSQNILSRGFYLWQCRVFSTVQPIPPRFFMVIGGQTAPWHMHELDIQTGNHLGDPSTVDATSFRQVWEQLGLTQLHRELRNWITRIV